MSQAALGRVLDAVLTNVTTPPQRRPTRRSSGSSACLRVPHRERLRNAIYFHLGGLELYPHAMAAHTKS